MLKKGVTVDQAVANVKDAIRYTFCYSEDAYTTGVLADCDRLADYGFELVERRNSWDKEQYKGINSRWREPASAQLFELQFHTQASLDAKEEYESEGFTPTRTIPGGVTEPDGTVSDLLMMTREANQDVATPQ